MIIDIPVLLNIRTVFSIILVGISLAVFLAFIISKGNGLTRAMAFERFIIACYVGVVVFISFVDVAPLPEVRRNMLAIWDIIHLLWIWASIWLIWKSLRNN